MSLPSVLPVSCWLIGCLLASPAAAAASQSLNDVIDGPPPPTPPEVVSRDSGGRVTVRAVRADQAPDIDGVLDDKVYQSVAAISDFVQQEPDEGEAATEKTEVWVLFDQQHVYISARCWDSQPEKMIANEMRRDGQNIFQNENFAVIFDTFYDRRNGFLFHTNPVGGLSDGYVTDERDTNRDWNTVWRSKSRRFDEGWAVEMAIPFKSLRYRPGASQIWGLNFRRIVRWKNEMSYLTRIPASYGMRGIVKLSSAATLVGIEPPSSSRNLEIKPYAVSAVTTDRLADPARVNDLTGDVGFDLKYGVSRSLTADATYNTDFAQVEDDDQQVNLTRFSLFFPEKREFFLEGQGIFSFGGVQGQRFGMGPQTSTPVLFFSRRIGLSEGRAVPIDAGGRLTGKAGKYSVGLLSIRTGDRPAAGASATTFSVARVKRDILRRSSIGLMATDRRPAVTGDGTNQAFGVDANLSFFQSLNLVGYYARTRTPGLGRDDRSYRARLDYAGDRYGLEIERLTVGDDFNPEVGFLRREDFERNFVQGRFSPRPKAVEAIRKVGVEASLEYITDGGGALESRQSQVTLRIDFENGDQWSMDYERNFEFLEEVFDISSGVSIPIGGYRFPNVRATYQLGPQRLLSGWLTFARGGFFRGDRTDASYRGRVELTPKVSIEPALSVNWIDLPQGRFVTKLASMRANFTFSPQMLLAALLQYNSSADSVTTNLRFRWEFEPGSDLFVVYSDGRDTALTGFPSLVNRSLAIKVTRLFRF